MINPFLLLILSVVALISAVLANGVYWYNQKDKALKVAFCAGLVSLASLLLSLGWRGFQQQHIPPGNLGELLLGLAALILLIYLGIAFKVKGACGILGVGLLLAIFPLTWGSYYAAYSTPQLAPEPLWLIAVMGRWLILLGIAGLYWLTIITAYAWGQKYFQRTSPFHQRFQQELEPLSGSKAQLRALATFSLLAGVPLMIGRSWQLGSGAVQQNAGLIVLMLVLTADWWLRFASTRRPSSEYALTILSFVVSLPLLGLIAA